MPLDKILCLSANAILTIIALWSIASVFFENATIDSIIARFSVASACMANLFSKHRLIRIIFLITLDLHPRITDKIERINL